MAQQRRQSSLMLSSSTSRRRRNINNVPLHSSSTSSSSSSSSSSTTSTTAATTGGGTSQQQRRNSSNNNNNNNSNFNNMKQIEYEIINLGRRGKLNEAISLYKSIDRPTIRLMNSVIDACTRNRPYSQTLQKAYEILEQETTTTSPIRPSRGLTPNIFTFGILMRACSRIPNNPSKEALNLLQVMQNEPYNVRPNAVVYSSAITACARDNPPNYKLALEILKEAKACNEINVIGYNAALSACASAGQVNEAFALLESMEDNNCQSDASDVAVVVKPDQVSYGTVLAAIEKKEDWPLLIKKAKEFEDRNITLDTMSITSVLHACQQLGHANEAITYLNKLKLITAENNKKKEKEGQTHTSSHHHADHIINNKRDPLIGVDDVAYRLTISACARGGLWEEGIDLLEDMRNNTKNGPDIIAYTAAITGCEYVGEYERASELIVLMRKKDNIEPNTVTFASLFGSFATYISKVSHKLQQDQQQQNNKNTSTNSLRPTDDIQKYLSTSVPKKKALRILKLMKENSDVVNPNTIVYNAAIRVCAEAMDVKSSFNLFDQLIDDGLKPTVVTFGSLMTAAERIGSIKDANRVFNLMKEHNVKPNEIIYGAAISCCRKGKQSKRCFKLLRQSINEGLVPNSATFNTVIVALTESKFKEDMDDAISVYKVMLSMSNNTNTNTNASTTTKPNRQTYSLLIRALAYQQRPNEAEWLLNKMYADDGYVPDVDLYTTVVTSYERTRQPLKSLKLMESMSKVGYDFYEIKPLNVAFKKAIEITNAVISTGKGTSTDGGFENNSNVMSNNTTTSIDVGDNEDAESINNDEG